MIRRSFLTILLVLVANLPRYLDTPCTAFLFPGQDNIPAFVQPNTVLCLHGGTYNHSNILYITSNTATYQAVPGEFPRIVGTGIQVSGHDVVLSNLIIDNGGVDGPSIPAIKLTGDHLTLRDNEITNGHYNGVEVRGQYTSLIHNFIHLFDGGTVDAECVTVFKTANYLLIQSNTINNCSGNGIEFYAPDNIFDPTATHNATIDGNILSRGTLMRGETGIGLKHGDGITITHNLLTGYSDYNWAVGARGWVSNVVIADNQLIGNYTGIELGLFDNGGSPHNILVTRNIVDNEGGPHLAQTGGGFTVDINGCFQCVISHNTLVGGQNYSIFVDGSLGWQGGSLNDNLIVYGVTPRLWSGSPFSGVSVSHNGWWGTNQGFLSSPTDMTGIGDPGFVDLAGHNYNLVSGSLASGLGAISLITPTPTSTFAAPTSTAILPTATLIPPTTTAIPATAIPITSTPAPASFDLGHCVEVRSGNGVTTITCSGGTP